ncbi:hypothetical protein ES705_34678 [subsurface metagenome]
MPLFEPDGLAGPITQIIELGSPGLAASDRLDIEDIRRVQREDSFDALVTDHSPDREVFINAPAFAGNDRAGKYLRSLFFALFDTAVNLNDITYLEVRDLVLETFTLNGV